MAEPKTSDPNRPAPRPTFAEVTREIARRNEQAQKAARQKRTAREREQVAARRRWESL